MRSFQTKQLAISAVVGAAYAALTLIFLPIAFGPVQCRVSEALCVLPFFFPGSVWGLFVGCILSNLVGGYGILDIVFGSLATLLAAWCTSKIRVRWLAPLPPVLINGIVVGAMLAKVLSPGNFLQSFFLFGAQVAAGELLAAYVLGLPILYILPKIPFFKARIANHYF
ncbi:MAG: QueT transporter family protein [Oscillospiraceae bacterium]|nr:QueT transporter family protein [Oscillospiraceae bacterium]